MKEIVSKFNSKKILVIGDLMLDKTIFGDVHRISPEAPVPVVNAKKETFVPGGAANTANNVVSLGGKAYAIGVVGNDEAKNILLKELEDRNIDVNGVVIDPSRPTTQKVRMLARHQQLLRVDYENNKKIDGNIGKKVEDQVRKILDSVDAVIISDYNKGLNEEELMQSIIQLANQKKKIVVVDSKSPNYAIFKDATVVKTSHHDASKITGLPIESEEEVMTAGKFMQHSLNCSVLLTRGEKGMTIFENSKVVTIPTKAKEVYDVTGAGDTVVAALTLALCSGASLKEAADIATHAAAVVISKIGTATATVEEILK
jgi:D-beta-D-heptose 7-phosphate kinase/D-beta-D-heptose 1-phosphate adenosyltransferase